MSEENQPPLLPVGEVTRLLERFAGGDQGATEELARAVYPRLLEIADRKLKNRHGGDLAGVTIEPAVLANDVLLRVLGDSRSFDNRRHFYSFAAQALKHLLTDYERARRAKKRGGHLFRVTLTGLGPAGLEPSVELSRVPEILDDLEKLDKRKAEVVQLRVFFGFEIHEIAELLAVSPATIDRDWRFSRRWLAARLVAEPTRRSDLGAVS